MEKNNQKYPFKKMKKKLKLDKRPNLFEHFKEVKSPLKWITKTPRRRENPYFQRSFDELNWLVSQQHPGLEPDWSDRGTGHSNPEWRKIRRLINPYVASSPKGRLYELLKEMKYVPPPDWFRASSYRLKMSIINHAKDAGEEFYNRTIHLLAAMSDIQFAKQILRYSGDYYEGKITFSSMEKTAQEPGEDASVPDEPPMAGEGEEPAEELGRILEPATPPEEESEQFPEKPENYFKRVKPNVPETIKRMPEVDKMRFYMLEKKRAEALNNLDISTLKLIDSEIEKLVEKYAEPVPVPKPIVDTTNVAGSVKKGSKNDKFIQSLYKSLLRVGLRPIHIGVAKDGKETIEFVVQASFPYPNPYGEIQRVLIIPWNKEKNSSIGFIFDTVGNRYPFDNAGAKEIIDNLLLRNMELSM